MMVTDAPSVERSEPFTFGHHHAYRRGKPTGRWVYVDGDTTPFLEVVPSGRLFKACRRCAGSAMPGCLPEYMIVHDGVCFECAGSGVGKEVPGGIEEAAKIVRRRNRRREREAARREAEAQRVASEHAAWREANAELVEALDPIAEGWAKVRKDAVTQDAIDAYQRRYGGFLIDMAEQAQYRPLSPAQAAAAAEAVERAHAWAAEHEAKAALARYVGTPGTKDKVSVTGTVVVWTTVHTDYGISALVVVEGTGEDAGVTAKMFGTGQTLWDCSKGDQVRVTGAVKAHEEYQGVKQTVLTRAKVEVQT